MVQYRLQYFDFRGLGEPIKLLLHYAGIPFKDEMFDIEGNWLGYKPNLRGKSDVEAARLDSIIDFFLEFYFEVRPYVLLLTGFITGDKQKLQQELWVPKTSYSLPLLENLLKETKTGFFSKDGVTWVDFFIAELNYTMKGLEPETYKNYPELIKHIHRVYELPQLKEYLDSRKHSVI
uniref:glutathione transferase n=1 Tax=Acrobeloides nanus TaxID=290746 RepID=A0A914DL21_9BILA